MSDPLNLQELRRKVREDGAYDLEAYLFVFQSLDYCRRKLKREGHVTGQELCEGIRKFATEQFGPLARMVFESWGVRGTVDFGKIVFKLIEFELMSKTDDDTLVDFTDVYDLQTAFPFPKPKKKYRKKQA